MLAGMTRRQLLEWLEFDEIDPFGEERADLRAGIVAAAVTEPHRDPEKRSDPFTPADFMPDFDGTAAAAEADEDLPMTQWQIESSFRVLSGLGRGTYTEAPA